MNVPKAVRVKTSTGWQDVALVGAQGPGGSSPIGSIAAYDGSTDPTDPAWVIADNRAVSRTTYADYFALVGTRHGAGDGSTTFNILNAKGRVLVGRDAAQAEFDTLGESGGAKAVLLSAAESGLRDHGHSLSGEGWYPFAGHVQGNYENLWGYKPGWQAVDAWLSDAMSNRSAANGSGAANATSAHTNLQPYTVVNIIVRVLGSTPFGMGLPVGSPQPWLVAAIPAGFREFDGSAIVQAVHPQLYALFGATIPDLRDRMLMGASGSYPISTSGGAATHTLTGAESGIQSDVGVPRSGGVISGFYNQYAANPGYAAVDGWFAGHGHMNALSAHNNLPPYRTVKWITVAG